MPSCGLRTSDKATGGVRRPDACFVKGSPTIGSTLCQIAEAGCQGLCQHPRTWLLASHNCRLNLHPNYAYGKKKRVREQQLNKGPTVHQPPIAKRGGDTEWLRKRPPLTFFLLLQAIEREILNCQGHSTRLKRVSAL